MALDSIPLVPITATDKGSKSKKNYIDQPVHVTIHNEPLLRNYFTYCGTSPN